LTGDGHGDFPPLERSLVYPGQRRQLHGNVMIISNDKKARFVKTGSFYL
jgi:hypothetical protein